MSIIPGTKLGHYEILAPIGAGGMGEVYRARDTKLGRDVALKVLPEVFARDIDRMARFEREAQVLASLNHPHIAAIYGSEESNGIRALVMELVEGPTLAERVDGRAIALEEALRIAKQIAEALEYAHEKGIIHRDLKPANVKLSTDGNVKVLDFGLAKALEEQAPVGNPSVSPTLTLEGTRAGVILGTAAYMSPEQARGAAADKRADIWGFGCVLYEMLTGKAVFHGDTTSDILAAVLKSEPDWSALPTATSLAIRNLIRRCLIKDRKQRLQAIGEARIVLENPTAEESAPVTPPSQSRHGVGASITAGVLLIALGILSFIYFRETPPQKTLLRYTIAAPENTRLLHSFAISPDGRYVAIAAAVVNGHQQLWLRALDALQAQPIPGTDDAMYPFWSPDSRYIGFYAQGQGKLKKFAVSGGPAQSLCNAGLPSGGSWNRANVILFASGGRIERVSADGGVPADVTTPKGSAQFPVFLPDGSHFLYYLSGVSAEQDGVYLGSLDGKENRRLLADESSVIFAAGRLLFIRENTLMAESFDAASGQNVGEEVLPVAAGVSFTGNGSYAPVTASETGVLLYEGGGSAPAGNYQMGWYDRSGKLLGDIGAPGRVFEPAISPDEKSVVFRRMAGNAPAGDLWLRDLTRGAEQRFTTDASAKFAPFWASKGDRIMFASARDGAIFNLYQKAANGKEQEEVLLASGNSKRPNQWSHDGRFIVYSENDPKTKYDIWVLPMDDGAEREARPRVGTPFLHSEFNELLGQFSPDAHWMAYTSDKTGHREVYVVSFPTAEGETRISIAGGEQPRWRADGKELFFVGADGKMMTVAVKAELPSGPGKKASFEPGVPQPLFETHLPVPGRTTAFEYDVTGDGKRFLLDSERSSPASVPPLTVVVNWDAGLKK